jgi:hypothetical protein
MAHNSRSKLRGWTVLLLALVFSVGPALVMPLSASASGWSGPQTLDTSAGSGAATITFGGNPHVFDWDADGHLRHCWWTGSSWPCETRDTQNGGRGKVAAVVAGGKLHVFYNYLYKIDSTGAFDYRIAHQMYDTSWHFDLPGGTAMAYTAGMDVAATVYGGNPHVFYTGSGTGTLRHLWWTGSAWVSEVLDGNGSSGGNGRTQDWVGDAPSTVVYGSQLHVFYNDSSTGALRHAWYNWGGNWGFENLDGPGSLGVNGRVGSRVTSDNNGSVALLYQNLPHVFFTGNGSGLRHCMWTGSAWYCETLDRYGFPWRIGADAASQVAASTYGTTLQVYYGKDNDLQHRWYTPGVGWNYDTLDTGSWNSPVGDWPASAESGGQAHVYYQGHRDLEQKWWSPGSVPATFTGASDPVVIQGGPNVMDLFETGVDGYLYHRWYSSGVWAGWENLGQPGAAVVGDVSVIVESPGTATIFARASDGGLSIRKSHPGGFDPWTRIASNAGGDPVAGTGSGFHSADVFYRDSVTNAVDSTWWNGTGWSTSSIPNGQLQGKPAVREAPGVIEVTVRGTTNEVWSNWFIGYWSGWADRHGQTIGNPATATSASGQIDLYVRSTNNTTPYLCNDSAGCTGWIQMPGTITDGDIAPVANSPASNNQDAFYRATNGSLWYCWGPNCAANSYTLGGGVVGTPSAIGGPNNRIDSFVRGTDNAIFWKYYSGGWSEFQSMGNQVTGSG